LGSAKIQFNRLCAKSFSNTYQQTPGSVFR